MKKIICDVYYAAYAVVTAKSGYTMMVGCSSKVGNANPVDTFLHQREWYDLVLLNN